MIGGPIGAAPIGATASGAPPPVVGLLADALLPVEDYALTLPVQSAFQNDALTASEAMFAGDVYYALRDALAVNDSLLLSAYPTLREAALIVDAAVATTVRKVTLSDVIRLSGLLRVAYDAVLAESLVVTATDSTTAYKLARLSERVLATGAATGYQEAFVAAAAALALATTAGYNYFEGALADALEATDELVAVLAVFVALQDTATFADTAVPAIRMSVALADAATITDATLPQATLTELFEDALGVTVAISFGGQEYVGFALNAANKAASTYTNYPFNSLARFNGRYFAMAEDGLYELTGDTDAGELITATLRTGLTNFSSQAMKRLPALYVYAKTNGDLVAKITVTSETGEKKQYWYTINTNAAGAVREHRLEPGKGLKSVYWQFELETVDGADLLLDTLALAPMTLNRRV